jgi:hypothetical protein
MPQPQKHASQAARQAAYRLRCRQARTKEQAERGLPALPSVPTLPGTARWTAAVSSARLLLETVQAEMLAYFEERSEVWQEGERGQAFTDRLEALETVLSSLEDVDET